MNPKPWATLNWYPPTLTLEPTFTYAQVAEALGVSESFIQKEC